MDTEETRRIRERIEAHKRRKHELELKEAKLGISADPSIKIGIEDCEREIQQLENKLRIDQKDSSAVKSKLLKLFCFLLAIGVALGAYLSSVFMQPLSWQLFTTNILIGLCIRMFMEIIVGTIAQRIEHR